VNEIPEKFPEQIIMYKILTKKISELRGKSKTHDKDFREIHLKIENYERERIKIRTAFPENFFMDYM
jgi:hypothetical protein